MYMICTECTIANMDTLAKERVLKQGPWIFRYKADGSVQRPVIRLSFHHTETRLTKNDMLVFRKSIECVNRAIVRSFADLMDRSDGRWIDSVRATQVHSILNMEPFHFKESSIVSD